MKIKQDRNKYSIGGNICEFRLEHDVTQEKIVVKLHLCGVYISRGTYSHIECGTVNVQGREILAFAEIFLVDMGDFSRKYIWQEERIE